ncbi:hypothetical protein EDB86DRAFT_2830043 [Lactarius hatsudake]|nr:hypothetical protein EDB86DRAFT_2830043 [Lactarius hatsudake]
MARPPPVPLARATPIQPHTPCPSLPAHARGRTVRPPVCAGHVNPGHAPRSSLPAHARGRTVHHPSAQATPTQPHAPRPSLLAYARGRTVRPAQPAHARGRPPQSLQHGRRQPSPALRAPPLPACVRKGTDRVPSPARARKGTDSAHPTPLGDAALAPRAPPLPAHERKGADGASTRATPAQPYAARARNGRDGTPTSVPSARATPVQPHAHHTASPVHERGGTTRLPPPHGLRQPRVDAPRHACARLGMQEGRCAQSSPLRVGCATPALPVYAPRPGGGAHARGAHGTRGGATRARAAHPSACAQGVRAKQGATRVGELRANGRVGASGRGCERERVMVMACPRVYTEGGGCRERGEAKPARGCTRTAGTPAPVDRLRRIHVK